MDNTKLEEQTVSDYKRAMSLSEEGHGARKIGELIKRAPSTVQNWISGKRKPISEWSEKDLKELNEVKTRKIRKWWVGKEGTMKGKKFSEGHKRKLSESKWGDKNPMWRGYEASKDAGRSRARRLYNAPEGHEIHHLDGNPLNNDETNIVIVTRKQHMEMDGRLEKLIELNKNDK